MPSSVQDLLASAGLTWHSVTPWGSVPPLERPGLYLVSTSADPRATRGPAQCQVSQDRVQELLDARPALTVAGMPADREKLTAAVRAMWPAGETVLYVGLAGTSVAYRVSRYDATRLGARAPHAGGWPIKLLGDLSSLHVHVAAARSEPGHAERAVLEAFMAGVSPAARAQLSDPELPLPFANLELTRGRRKRHRIGGAVPPKPRPGAPVRSAKR